MCGANRNLCSDGATSFCANNVFDFEDGTVQGLFADTSSAPAICGDAFSTCLTAFQVVNGAGFAHGGQFYVAAIGSLVPGAVRRLSVKVPLCNSGAGAATNLVGRTISAFMQAGSQGGSTPGNTFSIALTGRGTPAPVIVATADASTSGGAQNTGWRLVSGIVSDSAVARAATQAILSIELPATQSSMGFQIDDVRIGD